MARFRLLLAPVLCLSLLACPVADDDDTGAECSNFSGHDFPEVEITSPDNSTNFPPGDDVSVVASISDADTDLADLDLQLVDTINVTPVPVDVDLPSPDSQGNISFVVPYGTLDDGPHTLKIIATDPNGCTGEDSVFFCWDDPATCN